MKVAGKTIDVDLYDATVLQVDKYSCNGMFTANSPLRTYIKHTHVVFQLKDTGKTLSLDAENVELPMYRKQDVGLISLNKSIIGFANPDSDEYYYITDDFSKALQLGIPYILVWLTGLAGAIIVLSALRTDYAALWSLLPFVVAWLLYSVKKFIVNKEIETAVDKFMQDK